MIRYFSFLGKIFKLGKDSQIGNFLDGEKEMNKDRNRIIPNSR